MNKPSWPQIAIAEEAKEKRLTMNAVKRQELVLEEAKSCDPDLVCPTCQTELTPEHAHYKCLKCGYKDSCCF